MIMFYFSGTGNSKYIAELFCTTMGVACHSIEEEVDFGQLMDTEDVIGFCYPVYGSRVPRVMHEFAKRHMDSLKGKKLILFCTQMCFSGDGARAFTDIFPRGFAQVIYAEHFPMPNNVCNLLFLHLDDEKKVEKYLARAHKRMQAVCDEIQRGVVKKRGFNLFSRAFGLTQGMFFPAFERRGLKSVWVDEDCNACLLCVTNCPMKNLEIVNGKVVAKDNCTMCYRCINKCPQKAIAVYINKKVKAQYKGVQAGQGAFFAGNDC
ncbi:MAG: EFR1 family ferrodoxin [Clostridiales bacterium]|nr:EFR1 family ferrodoxin [Clostridiales bacterium]